MLGGENHRVILSLFSGYSSSAQQSYLQPNSGSMQKPVEGLPAKRLSELFKGTIYKGAIEKNRNATPAIACIGFGYIPVFGTRYLTIYSQNTQYSVGRKEKVAVLRIKPAVSLIFIFAGTLDWLTTVIGVTYFNAIETNSIIASIANTNLPAFAALKLAITLFAGTFFYLAEYALTQPENIKIRTYRYAHTTLKTACIAVTALLLIATLNNFIVIANAL